MIFQHLKVLSSVAVLTVSLTTSAHAEVKLHGLFTNNMVLQRDAKVPVWGTAAGDEKITVTIGDQKAQTTAANGKWRVTLEPLEAGGPHKLTVKGSNTLELDNVLIGEVWLCTGQSNMQWAVSQSADPEKTIAESANSTIRLFTVPRQRLPEPQTDIQVKDAQGRDIKLEWEECGPQTIGNFSAVAYAFGRSLQKQLNVPIGLISTNLGGTAAEEWTSDEVLRSNEMTANLAVQEKSSKLYNAMLHPLVPFAIRGAIWYQGESNAGRALQYRTLFPMMIKNWRDDFDQGDFPFLFVQLAPFMAIKPEPSASAWAELREAQLLTMLNVPNTAMAVITDVGDEKDIHPKQKAPVGERLALAARALAYEEDIEYSGPIYDSMKVNGNKVVLKFKHIGKGLAASGDKLQGFTIAGKDQRFHNAEAKIEGDTVVVQSEAVMEPVAVRYGWADYPVVNLANKNGLLASPFRTDKFPGVTDNNR